MPNLSHWTTKIRKGDVLESGSGLLRVVRAVKHYQTSPTTIRTNVTFAIKACSWTGRPYTVYTGNDLVQMGYKPVNYRWKLNSELDKKLERDFGADKCTMTCCEAHDIP